MRADSSALALVAVTALTTACASSNGAVPHPFPMVRPAAPQLAAAGDSPSSTGNATAPPDTYALTGTALALRGTRYRDGGSDPNGFDCSGFTQYVFGQHGLALPRDVKNQFGTGQPVSPVQISAGDLIFFNTIGPGVSHVGIALGGDEFVHAPSSTGVVRVDRLTASYWSARFVGARRIQSTIHLAQFTK
jgi:cell wall-associated NlpC family hydrolase